MLDRLIPQAYAQGGCTPGEGGVNLGNCLFLNETQTVKDVYTSPAVLVNTIVQNLFIFGGLFMFIAILFSGYRYITGGTDGKEDSKKVLKTALTGLIVMFAAYWIVQIVSFITGVPIIL